MRHAAGNALPIPHRAVRGAAGPPVALPRHLRRPPGVVCPGGWSRGGRSAARAQRNKTPSECKQSRSGRRAARSWEAQRVMVLGASSHDCVQTEVNRREDTINGRRCQENSVLGTLIPTTVRRSDTIWGAHRTQHQVTISCLSKGPQPALGRACLLCIPPWVRVRVLLARPSRLPPSLPGAA